MATSKTLALSAFFPPGSTIGAFLDPQQLEQTWQDAAVPAAVDSQIMSAAGTVTFTGLTNARQYLAGMDMGGGDWRYVQFDSFG